MRFPAEFVRRSIGEWQSYRPAQLYGACGWFIALSSQKRAIFRRHVIAPPVSSTTATEDAALLTYYTISFRNINPRIRSTYRTYRPVVHLSTASGLGLMSACIVGLIVWLIAAVVCMLAAPRVQYLFADASNG